MLWVLLIILLGLFTYFKIIKPLSYWKNEGILYIKPYPLVGNMLPLVLGQKSFLALAIDIYHSINARYYGIYQFTKPLLVIKDVDLIKQICIKDFEYFADHKTFVNETNEPVFTENLFSAEGEQWKALRAMLSPAFTGSKMRSMFILISDCSERFTNYFVKTSLSNKPLDIELKQIFKRFTVDIIATCAFGIENNSLEDEHNKFYEMGKRIGDFSGVKAWKPLGFLMCPALMRFFNVRFFSEEQLNFFREIVSSTISYREKNNVIRPDLIHLLMQARKGQLKFEDSPTCSDAGFATIEESDIGKNSDIKLDITDDVIIAQAMIFFLGGTETTSILLSFAGYELAINPDIQRRLQDEIDQVFKECNGKLRCEDVSKMKYLDMVVSESMRHWPQNYFLDRLCVKDYTIQPKTSDEKPYVIRKGESIFIPVAGIQKDPKFYEEPDRFNPERFNDENKHKINQYTFLPFGKGPRSCIGNRFALLVVKTILFYLLLKFDIVVTKKTDIPFNISKTQLFINAKNGFWVGLQKRTKN